MKARYISTEQFELDALRELSARIGRNPLLVQASSGNTSVKIDEVLWIKASGKWLIHAAEEHDFLVPVKLAKARTCLRENTLISETETKSASTPGASIETAMHAVLPHKVVVHVHSVNTIAWAVRQDGPRQLGERLSGLAWQWVPYTPSGTSLAKKIGHALSCFPQTNVFILANHGLVVCGRSCRSVEELLTEVEQRLAIEPRPAPELNYALLKQALPGSAWCVPACAGVHALATDHISRRIFSGGVLYPCQAIFLPAIMPVLTSSLPLEQPRRGQRGYARQQALRIIEDHGVLASEHMTRAEQEMLVGLASVVQRIDASAPVRYLTASEVIHVLNGEVDNYRRTADANCHSKGSDPGTSRTA
jgi:rhamnose utilization protein RhaD (predicted bifunctional aldolase and dehydrogenase)